VNTFALRVMQKRRSRGLSQHDLANLAGTTTQIVSDIESGNIPATLNLAIRLAVALEESLDYLTGIKEETMSNFHQLSFWRWNDNVVLDFEDYLHGQDKRLEIDRHGQASLAEYNEKREFLGMRPVNLYDELIKLLYELEERE